jgi:hypothetical protein
MLRPRAGRLVVVFAVLAAAATPRVTLELRSMRAVRTDVAVHVVATNIGDEARRGRMAGSATPRCHVRERASRAAGPRSRRRGISPCRVPAGSDVPLVVISTMRTPLAPCTSAPAFIWSVGRTPPLDAALSVTTSR